MDGHPGRRVYGQARRRGPVRSSHSYAAWRYGHRWVALAVLVRFPLATRRWALPVLVALYRAPELGRAEGRSHRTPAQLTCRLLRLLLTRFPGRRFAFVGDSGFGAHETARFRRRHRGRPTLVSQLHPDANLFDPPPEYRGTGRPPAKGRRRPEPRQAVARARRLRPLSVGWHGGGTRRVGVVTGTGHRFKSGRGPVPIGWVFVRDRAGTHRGESLYSTDPALAAAAVIGPYCGRWDVETTFPELRPHWGLETTRGWCRQTVLRAAPCLFGLYTVVARLYHLLPPAGRAGAVVWPG